MKKYFLLTFVLLVLIGWQPIRTGKVPSLHVLSRRNVPQETGPLAPDRAIVSGVVLNSCRDNELGVKFFCNFGWKQHKKDDALFISIDTAPKVDLKIFKIDLDIMSIQQLSRDKLEAIGQYMEGFAIEEAKMAGLNAIKVKAFSRIDPNTRLNDYYFVHDQALYGLMFSVNPKEKWDDYQFLFQEVAKSFEFSRK